MCIAALRDASGPGAAKLRSLRLERVNIDDWFFGVQAVSADGYASPVVFPGPAGAFESPPAKPAS